MLISLIFRVLARFPLRLMQAAGAALGWRVWALSPRYRRQMRENLLAAGLPLDPYAARDPAEFFAVASEAFFVAPAPLADDYPEIHRLLAAWYRQDPLARVKPANSPR